MQVLYEPRGAAREYAPLAVNLYRGCIHGCTYCYVPAVLRTTPAEFHSTVRQRTDILRQLRGDIAKTTSRERVHLCFTCDPYPPAEVEQGLTRRAILTLRDAGFPVAILTKAGARATRDLDVLASMDAEVGVTLAWANDARRAEFEPLAAPVSERLDYLAAAKAAGIRTWVSMEPVIDPAEALAILPTVMELADTVKVGRWNHNQAANAIDWTAFAREVKHRLVSAGKPHLLKKGLAELVAEAA